MDVQGVQVNRAAGLMVDAVKELLSGNLRKRDIKGQCFAAIQRKLLLGFIAGIVYPSNRFRLTANC